MLTETSLNISAIHMHTNEVFRENNRVNKKYELHTVSCYGTFLCYFYWYDLETHLSIQEDTSLNVLGKQANRNIKFEVLGQVRL